MANALEVRSPLPRLPRPRVRRRPAGADEAARADDEVGAEAAGPAARSARRTWSTAASRGSESRSAPGSAGELRPWIEDLLLDPASLERGYFDPEEVRRAAEEHLDGRADHTYRVWNLADAGALAPELDRWRLSAPRVLFAIGGLGRGGLRAPADAADRRAHPERIEATVLTFSTICDAGPRAAACTSSASS